MEAVAANVNLEAVTVHCPFGCTLSDCDEHGYCCHLIGFTNDGKTLEPVRPHVSARSGQPTGKKFVDGRKKQKVQPGDTLVNPESVQIDNGAMHMKKAWVSSRVYREDVERREPEPERTPEDEIAALKKRLAELEAERPGPTDEELEALTAPAA